MQLMKRAVIALALGTATLLGVSQPATAAEPSCSRSCLTSVLDRYMAAVFKHAPTAAPLSANHKATLNGAPLAQGAEVWRTATGYGEVQRRFLDPQSGGAVYFGELMQGKDVAIVSVRIKVVSGRITEAEWTVGTGATSHMFNPQGLRHYPPPLVLPLAAADRVPRAQLIATANAYFEALENHDGKPVPRITGCDRIENGAKMTHRRRGEPFGPPANAASAANPDLETGDCTAGFEGFKNSIVDLRPRRFPVVDEEAGVVMATAIFHRPPGVTQKRNLATEFFFERGGKIASIYAAMADLEHSAPDSPGW